MGACARRIHLGQLRREVLEQADVVVTPGAAYGASGEGYVRLSLTLTDDRLREAVRRIEEHVRL